MAKDYIVTFNDNSRVEITEVQVVYQKGMILEFRGAKAGSATYGELPLIIAYNINMIKQYEPSENARPTILPQIRRVSLRRSRK